jgi:hypothetical protein
VPGTPSESPFAGPRCSSSKYLSAELRFAHMVTLAKSATDTPRLSFQQIYTNFLFFS